MILSDALIVVLVLSAGAVGYWLGYLTHLANSDPRCPHCDGWLDDDR